MKGLFRLLLEGEIRRTIFYWFPVIGSINLIQSDNERSVSLLEQFERLKSLIFQAVLKIDNQYGNIA